jgi:MFS family permease
MPSHPPSTRGFLMAAGVVAHTLWTSVAPTIVYPLYAQQWDLTPTAIGCIFAVYPLVVVATLVLFGSLSDALGSRRMMLYGVAASALGVLVFVAAMGPAMLFAGRILMGVGVGLSAGPSAAALVEFAGKGGVRRASAVTLAAQAFGFAAALILGGALAQYAPYPTRLSFLLLLVLLVTLLLGIRSLPPQEARRPVAWRPSLPHVPRELRGVFWFAAFTLMTAYADGALIGSLGAQIAHDLVRSENLLVNGATLALFPIALGAGGLAARGLRAPVAILKGAIAAVAGMAFMAAAVAWHDLTFLVAASLAAGAGYAFMVYGGLATLSEAAPDETRGSITSAALVLSYLFSGVLAMGLGGLATALGMVVAVAVGVVVIAVLAIMTVSPALRWKRRGCAEPGAARAENTRGV